MPTFRITYRWPESTRDYHERVVALNADAARHAFHNSASKAHLIAVEEVSTGTHWLYSRVPEAAIFTSVDGLDYARIPHRLSHDGRAVVEDYNHPRMVRYVEPESYKRGGEACVLFAKLGPAIPIPANLPFAVTVVEK